MAEGGPPAPQPSPVVPATPASLVQPLAQPAHPDQLVPPPQPGHQPPLNWSHLKPEFAGKPEDDVEAHLLCTIDWMDTHNFLDYVKVQRFCLMLIGEERLWYESIRPIENKWQELQDQFRQQYSKIGNMRENYFMHGDLSTMMKM